MNTAPYHSIEKRLGLGEALPYTENWSAAADFLELLIDHCLTQKPSRIFECSSGLSTLVLARCCQINQQGSVTSLENGAEYAQQTQANLQRLELDSYAAVVHAPLEPMELKGRHFNWYSLPQPPMTDIDLLVIDGPPGFLQHHSRYPALPLLASELNHNASIFLDDAARQEEKEIVDLWLEQYPGLRHRYIDTERGCSILEFAPDQDVSEAL